MSVSQLVNWFYRVETKPVFVLGNQKSGTTAIASLLAERANLSATIDTSVLWEPNLSDLLTNKVSLAEVVYHNKKPFSRKLIKEPNLTFLYPQVVELFPDAKFIFIIRDPRSNIRSLLNRIDVAGNLAAFNDIEAIPPLWRSLLSSAVAHNEHYITALAKRWNYCANTYLEHHENCFLIKYEDFLLDKQLQIDAAMDYLQLQPRRDISSILDKSFQPPGHSHIPWLTFFGNKNLGNIENICAPQMKLLDYSPTTL